MKRIKLLAALALALLTNLSVRAVTLDYCLEKAEENYPLIKKYGIVEKTAELSLEEINRSWLPRIGVYAQASVQNVVPQFPESLRDVLAKLGQDSEGIGHLQYKIGVDLFQTIWDGGASKSQREIERRSTDENQAAIAVQMYAVREKVMNLYFGILLMEAQIAQTENTLALINANHTLMQSMLAGGVAMQSDVDMVEAQALAVGQQITGARSAVRQYRELLSIYVGENLQTAELQKPEPAMPEDLEPDRPELTLFDARSRLNAARLSAVETSVMPRVGLFAQAWYGYPGIDYFKSMMNRDLSFNVLAGVKISWNIDSFYTKKISQRKLALADSGIDNDREVFLYNIRLQTASQREEIEGIRALMADDSRIVALRSSVRTAVESQLKNGVIDATALLAKITDENQARLASSYHEIQLLQNIYKLKYTLNR